MKIKWILINLNCEISFYQPKKLSLDTEIQQNTCLNGRKLWKLVAKNKPISICSTKKKVFRQLAWIKKKRRPLRISYIVFQNKIRAKPHIVHEKNQQRNFSYIIIQNTLQFVFVEWSNDAVLLQMRFYPISSSIQNVSLDVLHTQALTENLEFSF